MPGWLSEAEWNRIQGLVPIVCVDLLPIRRTDDAIRFGLIRRDTPHQGLRWCLVGGRVFLNQSLEDACEYHLVSTLGDAMRFELPHPFEPATTSEYFSVVRDGCLHDPRQHAVALVFAVAVAGTVSPRGEAVDFRWFAEGELPAENEFGFGQHRVLRAVLARLQSGAATAGPA